MKQGKPESLTIVLIKEILNDLEIPYPKFAKKSFVVEIVANGKHDLNAAAANDTITNLSQRIFEVPIRLKERDQMVQSQGSDEILTSSLITNDMHYSKNNLSTALFGKGGHGWRSW